MEHDMAGMEHMGHTMPGMAEIATSAGFDYSLALMAGFFGSGHCLGMCGALVSGYFMNSSTGNRWLPYFVYQLARIGVYTLIGVSAAALSVVLVASGVFGKMQSVLQMLIGTVVIVLALGILGWIPWQGSIRLIPAKSLRSGYAAARRQGPVLGAAIAGFLNGLMPCPLTFAMYVKAASAPSLLEGGALMLAFGAGTLPMMLFISVAFGKIHARVRGLMLKVAALVMIVMGGNTFKNGLSFYLQDKFHHHAFLESMQNQVDQFSGFLHRLAAYIADLISNLHAL